MEQFNKLKEAEFDWDNGKITQDDLSVKLAIYKEQNRCVCKMADFYLIAGRTGQKRRLNEGIKNFIGDKQPLLIDPNKKYDRTVDRGK